jgi:DNA-binding MarR family transcriptional regulator
MGAAEAQDGGRNGLTDPNKNGGLWRSALIEYASKLRECILRGEAISDCHFDLESDSGRLVSASLGAMAQEAARIVEVFSIGAAQTELRASGNSTRKAERSPEFVSRINIILNGLENVSPVQAQPQSSSSVIQSELWQLLYKVRESAEMAYARELDLVELDRRILFLLTNLGPLVPAEISSSVGVDKAQVSRSVKRLLEVKMVQRTQLRAPLTLTQKGRTVSERLLRLADLRNRELTFDIVDEELAAFFTVIEKLLDQAVLLYEQERRFGQGQEPEAPQYPRPGAAVESESKSDERIALDRTRIISPLMTLSSYFSRSGSLAFKRLTKLSNFEAWVLNEIGMRAPIQWNDLVERLDRDHSQAGRTINSLLKRGLIVREGKPGRRHGRFTTSSEGEKLYQVIQEASRSRSAFLMAPLSKDERESFLGTFDKIKRNAVIQLERERTFEELG